MSSVNIKYYVKISDLANNKIFDIDTSKEDQASSVFNLIVSDSIFDMYPHGNFTLEDDSGRFYNDIIFAEGHKYLIEMGYTESKEITSPLSNLAPLSSEFYWSSNGLLLSDKATTISGLSEHKFTHAHHLKDGFFIDNTLLNAKRFYKNKTASDVVKSIIYPNFIKEEDHILITKTQGTRDWYLGKYTDIEFIDNVLLTYSKSSKNESPFASFFNLRDEFHFRSFFDLFNNKPLPPKDFYTNLPAPTLIYTLRFSDPDYISKRDSILSYNFNYVGTEIIQRLINMKSYHVKQVSALTTSNKSSMDNQLYSQFGKLPIKNSKALVDKREDNVKDIKYHGLYKDDVTFKAYTNSLYVDSTSLIRMDITIYFNPEAVSGRVIYLNFFDNEGLNLTLTGEWLIIKSEHKYEKQAKLGNRMILTSLHVGKNSFNFEEDNSFYAKK